MECKPVGMDEGMSLIMMRMRRSLRTVLREAVAGGGAYPQRDRGAAVFGARHLQHRPGYQPAAGDAPLLGEQGGGPAVRRGYVESSQDKQDRRVSRLRLLPASQSAVQRLPRPGGLFIQAGKGVTQEEFAAFFSMVGKMVDNLGDMPLEDELRLENEFEKGSVKGQ